MARSMQNIELNLHFGVSIEHSLTITLLAARNTLYAGAKVAGMLRILRAKDQTNG
jgi:hypothetical protein